MFTKLTHETHPLDSLIGLTNRTLPRFLTYTIAHGVSRYSESGIYYPGGFNTIEEYNAYVDTFPFADDPDIFGLHPNANIAYQVTSTSVLLLLCCSLTNFPLSSSHHTRARTHEHTHSPPHTHLHTQTHAHTHTIAN